MDGCLQTPKCLSSLKLGTPDEDVGVCAAKSTWPVCCLALFGI